MDFKPLMAIALTLALTSPAIAAKSSPSHKAPDGAAIYAQNCAACHGVHGLGDGPAAASMKPPPRNLVAGKYRFGRDLKAVTHTIANGSPGTAMPSFKGTLSPAQVDAVARYVVSLQKAAKLPVPKK